MFSRGGEGGRGWREDGWSRGSDGWVKTQRLHGREEPGPVLDLNPGENLWPDLNTAALQSNPFDLELKNGHKCRCAKLVETLPPPTGSAAATAAKGRSTTPPLRGANTSTSLFFVCVYHS